MSPQGIELLLANLRAGIVKVLVIDDDPDICMGLKDILQDAGYHVDTASCEVDGRRCFQRETYSILVVDYSLPDANGIQIAQTVRVKYPWVQTILMTGHDRVEIAENHESSPLLGAFLRKPIDVQTILSVLEQMLHRQCDRLQIARFSPQHEPVGRLAPPVVPDPPKEIKPVPIPEPVRVAPPRVPPKKVATFWIVLFAFVLGGATGWYGHEKVKQPSFVVREPIPTAVTIPIPAAEPMTRVPENKLIPGMTEMTPSSDDLTAAPVVAASTSPVVSTETLPIPAPEKAIVPPPEDSEVDSDTDTATPSR